MKSTRHLSTAPAVAVAFVALLGCTDHSTPAVETSAITAPVLSAEATV